MSVPSVFGLPHLSEDAVAAFADGVLAPAAAARATRHCRECEECAEAVRGQREAVFLLRSAMAPALPIGLLDRLARLPMSADLPPPSSGLPTTLDAQGNPVFIAHHVDVARGGSAEFGPHGLLQSGQNPDLEADFAPRSEAPHRRGLVANRRTAIPLGLLASVAVAVTAVGALGGQEQSARTGPNNSANLSGAIPSGQTHQPGPRSAGSGNAAPARPSSGPVAVSYFRSGNGPIVPSSSGAANGRP